MMLATTRILLPLQKYDEAVKILKLIAEQSRVMSGCIDSHIYRDLEEKNVILLEGRWRNLETLENYLRSEEYRNLLLVVEMALERPEIRFDTISNSTGIETIEKAREKK